MKLLSTLLGGLSRSKVPQGTANLLVGEGLLGNWRYHLHHPGSPVQALCGTSIMRTRIPLEAWGVTTELHERYCAECAALAGERLANAIQRAEV
jgi:hypothetical protein